MDQPGHKSPGLVQPSIRSFFQPRQQPTYAAPPSAASTSTSDADPPRVQDATKSNTNSNSSRAIEPQQSTAVPSAAIPQPPPPPPVQIPGAPQPPAPAPTTPALPSALPHLPPPPSLHPNATITPITATHIPALRRINSLLLQIPYPDSFYATILTTPTSSLFSRAILWSDPATSSTATPKVVGGIVCRLESPTAGGNAAIYIQSLTLLSPYRGLGLASAALEHVISTAALLNLDPAAAELNITTIYAHVWTENTDGLRWYNSRGFKTSGNKPVAGYYFRLRPDTAWVVSRSIGTGTGTGKENMASHDHLQQQHHTDPGESQRQDRNTLAAEAARGRGTVLAGAVNLAGFENNKDKDEGQKTKNNNNKKSPPPPPPPPPSARPTPATSQSYQKLRPETEWNDLPPDMVASATNSGTSTPNLTGGPTKAPHLGGSAPGSGASSRSSSTVGRKKRERAYPAAAFGS